MAGKTSKASVTSKTTQTTRKRSQTSQPKATQSARKQARTQIDSLQTLAEPIAPETEAAAQPTTADLTPNPNPQASNRKSTRKPATTQAAAKTPSTKTTRTRSSAKTTSPTSTKTTSTKTTSTKTASTKTASTQATQAKTPKTKTSTTSQAAASTDDIPTDIVSPDETQTPSTKATSSKGTKATSTKAASTKAASTKATSTKAASTKAASTKATSTKAASTKATSTKATSTKAASRKSTPASTEVSIDPIAMTAAPLAAVMPSAGLMPVNIGIDESDRGAIAQGLSRLLADTYSLYLKTHNFHWNVTGPMFQTLHLLFETQYTELALAVDLIAERIRALGFPAPGTYSEYAQLSSIPETAGVPEATAMIRLLVEGQEAVVRTARSIFPLVDQVNDEPSADLLTQRMQIHEKNAWMLRSLLG